MAGATAQVGVQLPEAPAPVPQPQVPAVPDPSDAVDNVRGTVDDVVREAPGAGRSDPASPASPAPARTGAPGGGGGTGGPAASPAPQGDGDGREPSTRGGDRADRGGDGAGSRGRAGARERRETRARRRAAAREDARGPAATASRTAARGDEGPSGADEGDDGGVTRTLERVVEVVPTPVKLALLLLGGIAAYFFARSQLHARRNRRLTEQREELLQDVGLLQEALLPEIPEKLGDLATSVAYRPADGPAAGGDFYDAFLLDGERVAIIVGDVSGHGRAALARTALMRYTLRAYMDAGLEPRRALQVAGQALDDDLGGDFATVVLAIHDPARATLTYASAGHPPPLVSGSTAFDPVTALSSPPIGAALPTGQRQTTLHLPSDAIACFFTDGLVEAKRDDGLVGRDKLFELLGDLGPRATAQGLIDAVASYADETPDDMAACVLRPDEAGAVDHVPDRLEEVELTALDLGGDRIERYLAACGLPAADRAAATKAVEATVAEFDAAILRVRIDRAATRWEVDPAAGLDDPLGAPARLPDPAEIRAGADPGLV